MLCAARAAISNGQVAIAPCSGFHHAQYSRGEGYCTFNGLMVTALVLQKEGVADRVGILDFDLHYGNGTDQIIDYLHVDLIKHYSAGEEYFSPTQTEEFLNRIPHILSVMSNCDVILYQAGADAHRNDPMGGWLSTEQMMQRDRLVFLTAKAMCVPIAWNLAGGYQTDANNSIRPVLDLHDNTLLACIETYGQERVI